MLFSILLSVLALSSVALCQNEEIFYASRCEGEVLELKCDNPDAYIVIKSAFYGRVKSGSEICYSSKFINGVNNCDCAYAFQIVDYLCTDLNSCTINANNDQFPDPCSGIYKYLEVEYECVEPEIEEEIELEIEEEEEQPQPPQPDTNSVLTPIVVVPPNPISTGGTSNLILYNYEIIIDADNSLLTELKTSKKVLINLFDSKSKSTTVELKPTDLTSQKGSKFTFTIKSDKNDISKIVLDKSVSDKILGKWKIKTITLRKKGLKDGVECSTDKKNKDDHIMDCKSKKLKGSGSNSNSKGN